MKSVTAMLILVGTLVFVSAGAIAQTAGDYASNGTGGGNWNAAATWQVFNGSSWGPAGSPPTGSNDITIQLGDSIYINVPVSITNRLENQGKLGGVPNLTIGSGGTFQHAQDGGSLPRAVWDTGSTLLMTGPTGVSPDNRNQGYYNVTFNTPGLLSNLNMGFDSVTIRGDIRVINTGSARWQMTGPLAGDSSIFSIMGDIIVTGGAFSSNGTSNANTKIVVHHYGSIVVTGGNLSVSRGSQGSGTGSTRWHLHEGNFSMSGATTQNSNPTNAWFVFDKAGTQTLTLGSGNTLTALPIEVSGATTLNMGESKLRGSGIFRLLSGATLVTACDGGLDSAVSVTGNVTLPPDANFTFNGTVPQVTGTLMPATVADLTIDNLAGVTLTQFTTINDTLHLKAGVFNAGVGYALGPSGVISYEGGTISSIDSPGDPAIPLAFFIEQNYPNPFNPSTTIRYGLPAAAEVTVAVFDVLGREVATLVEGRQAAGVHAVGWDASHAASGLYLCRIQAGTSVGTTRMMLIK
jgi:hypothetical protein